MTPEYYSDLYRHFATFARNYGDNRLYRVAVGANAADYNWTEVLMKNAGRHMQGLSLHYYTVPKDWDKGSALILMRKSILQQLKKLFSWMNSSPNMVQLWINTILTNVLE